MAGIAGIAQEGRHADVEQMLSKIAHRGGIGLTIIEVDQCTLGIVCPQTQYDLLNDLVDQQTVLDKRGKGHFVRAYTDKGDLILERDLLGIAPLYYCRSEDGIVHFASEVKALIDITDDIHSVLPGYRYTGRKMERIQQLVEKSGINNSPMYLAKELYRQLSAAVERYCTKEEEIAGVWLSGGLDSSAIAALVRPHVDTLHTFVAGLAGSSDLKCAREVANFLHSEHHEIIIGFDELVDMLPEVIYHLESFDALLVRSSVTNYLVGRIASDYVPAVFSGEGADELFAGYEYLKAIDGEKSLSDELIDITRRLHNTALQRVDRSASAHGLVAYVPFLDPDVVDFAFSVPIEYKLHGNVGKWILRKAMDGLLPKKILERIKVKFWHGAGVDDLLAEHAAEKITDSQFKQERTLANGWVINTKEELMYYRIFKDHFGDLENLSWMGRTKGSPKN